MMADIDIQPKALDALGIMHTAIRNVFLYPPASPMITNAIEKLHLILLDIFEQKAPLIFAESEKKALICGKLLDQKDRETIQVTTLLNILLNFGIKSISFDKGLEKEELSVFIKIISKTPEVIKDEGGLPKIMAEKNILHIYLDEKVYIPLDKDQKIISRIDINEDKSFESPTSNAGVSAEDQNPEITADLEKVISRLVDDLFNENAEVRAQASNGLTGIIESLSPGRQGELVGRLSGRLVEWIKLETLATPAYKKICHSLQKLLQNFIRRERFAETIPILDVFNNINAGILKKDDAVREISLEIIRNLASENNLLILFKELNTNEKNKRVEANQILAKFGEVILNKLLDIVREVSDSNERVRTMHLIIGMGQRAIPAIKERIDKNAAWYYLRNLAYILGRIGNEADAYMLQPLLLHENDKVRMEALKSVSQIGGNQKGQLLLSALPHADD